MNFSELLVIFLVALLVFGPKQLVTMAETLGRLTARVRGQSQILHSTVTQMIEKSDQKNNRNPGAQ